MNKNEERRKRLNEVVQSNHLTLIEIERLTGVGKSTVQRYLTGETSKIPIDFYEKMAAITNVPISYLTCFDDESTPVLKDRDVVVEKINSLPEDKIDKLLGYLDGLSEK